MFRSHIKITLLVLAIFIFGNCATAKVEDPELVEDAARRIKEDIAKDKAEGVNWKEIFAPWLRTPRPWSPMSITHLNRA